MPTGAVGGLELRDSEFCACVRRRRQIHRHVNQLVLCFCFVFAVGNERRYRTHADVFFACSVLVFKRFLNCSEEPRNEPLPETLVNTAALDVLGVGLLPDLVLAC